MLNSLILILGTLFVLFLLVRIIIRIKKKKYESSDLILFLMAVFVWVSTQVDSVMALQDTEEYKDHIELVDFIKMIAIPENSSATVSSWRMGADSKSKIQWITNGRDALLSAREGRVFIKINDKPTIQEIIQKLEPISWKVTLLGAEAGVFTVSLEADRSWEDYVDFGEYLVSKGDAKKIEDGSSHSAGCEAKWYIIDLKGYKRLWLYEFWTYGNRRGYNILKFQYDEPEMEEVCESDG